MGFEQGIGILASILTACALLPQLVKILREKKPGDISFFMLAILFTGLSFWVYYGILKSDWIIIVSNSFSLVINTIIFIASFIYKKKRRPAKIR